jgi:hypothetical protein
MSGIYIVSIVEKTLRGIKPTTLHSFFLGYASYWVSTISIDTAKIMFLVMAYSCHLSSYALLRGPYLPIASAPVRSWLRAVASGPYFPFIGAEGLVKVR